MNLKDNGQLESPIQKLTDPSVIEQMKARKNLINPDATLVGSYQQPNDYLEVGLDGNYTTNTSIVNPLNLSDDTYNKGFDNAPITDNRVNYGYQNAQVIQKPIHPFFVGIKKTLDFTIPLEINTKIPSLNFIKMLEESVEVSYVDYITDELYELIINDSETIKQTIKNKLLSELGMLPPTEGDKKTSKPTTRNSKKTTSTEPKTTPKSNKTTPKNNSK